MPAALSLSPAAVVPPPPPAAPDVAVAALPLFARLRAALQAAAATRAARPRWGVPPLFFFDRALQAEWEAARPAAPRPDADLALADLLADAAAVLTAGAAARHAARAVPGLAAAAAALAPTHPGARRVAGLLAVADDEVVRVVHPGAGAGFLVWVRGVADAGQFQALLADAVTGDPARGRLPGPRVLAAARFQLVRPAGLRPDGTLPAGVAGVDHWVWGREPVTALPVVAGERAVLLADPAVPAAWDAEPSLPGVTPELEVVEVMTPAEVADWIAGRTGRPAPRARGPERKAA